MKIKYIASLIAIVAISKNSFAQYSQDAIRFSTTETGSSSRIKAIGNANTAIGGDVTNVSGNPAGLGFFTRSELSVTPEFGIYKAQGNYLGFTSDDKKNSGNLNNAAVVFYSRLSTPQGADKSKGWLSLNFGLGYSRVQDFNRNLTYGGTNTVNSITDYYANRANESGTDLIGDWAYDQKLIDLYNTSDGKQYLSNVLINDDLNAQQRGVITRTGGQSEFNIAVGANHSNKFYIGAAIGITSLRYKSVQSFDETGTLSLSDNNDDNREFASSFVQNQLTRGTGVNIKLGTIFKPVEELRVGINFTSPTWYSMEDAYSESLSTTVVGDRTNINVSDLYIFNYNLRTPLKIAGGLAYFIGNYGFITGDVEYVDYSSAHLSSDDGYFDSSLQTNGVDDNADIKTLYQGAVNTRFGAEARLGKFAYLRGGYNIFGNPSKDNGSTIKTASGGLGYRSGHYSVDATYLHRTGTQTFFPYEIGNASPSADIKNKSDNLFLTLSYRF